MKFLRVIGIIAVVAIAGLIVAALIFIKTFDINKYKPQITERVSAALGRKVDIGRLELRLALPQGVGLAIEDISIADNPAFSKSDFLKVPQVSGAIDCLAYFFRKEIVISNLQFVSPQIVLIRDENGRFNVQTFEINSKVLSFLSAPVPQDSFFISSAFAAEGPSNLPPVLIQAVTLKNGTLTFIDRSFEPNIHLPVTQIDLAVKNFSLTQSCPFSLKVSLFSSRQNVFMNGKAAFDINQNNLHLEDVHVASDLEELSIDELNKSLPMIKPLGLKKAMQGKLEVTVQKATAGPKGLLDLLIEGRLKDGAIEPSQLKLPFEKIQSDFEITQSDMTFKNISAQFAGGTLQAQGKINDYLKSQAFNFEIKAGGINAHDIAAKQTEDVDVEGKIEGEFAFHGQGLSSIKENLKQTAGEGSVRVKEGKLLGMNILQVVLSKIPMLPGLDQFLSENLSDEYKKRLQAKDTIFKTIEAQAGIKEGALALDQVRIETEDFSAAGSGLLHLNLNINMQAKITIGAGFSKELYKAREELKYLADNNGQITMPLIIGGKITKPIIVPDVNYLGQRILLNKGGEALDKYLDKALGTDNGGSKDALKGQIKNILGNILGGGQNSETTPSESAPQGEEQNQNQTSNPSKDKPSSDSGTEAIQSLFKIFK